MDKLKMQSMNKVDENILKIGKLFPNCITEKISGGGTVRCIDFDALRQELSDVIVEGNEERYQFTWPDKKKSVLLANAPTNKTLRPCREESFDFDNTENLYIEGDNLEVLKLLQETYLGKIKMIYIDPPYNTGDDFVYNDDFTESIKEFLANSGQFDNEGYRLVKNLDSNGRFHTDWLNMIYPRLKLARDLLQDDGIIFISIDYNENFNMRKIADEIFGASSFVGEICWESKTKSQNTSTAFNKLQPKVETILVYIKQGKARFNLLSKGKKEYPFEDENGRYREHVLEVMNSKGIRGRETMIFPISDGVATVYLPEGKQWKLGQNQVSIYKERNDLFIRDNKVVIKMRPSDERTETTEPFWGFFPKEMGTAESAKKELSQIISGHGFETVKPIEVLKRLIFHATTKEDYILDFFSGSATTAHAVMELNEEDNGNRKFILVQIPEKIDEDKEAYESGFHTVCEIGKERIRRVAQKIKDNNPLTMMNLDIGFRVLKCDSSNMKDVYYSPFDYKLDQLDMMVDNIKEDRTPEDLLFQVMLDLGIELSSKIEETEIAGKKVFNVAEGFLIACFDKDVSEETIGAVAKEKPYYFVMRDSSMAVDSVATNFDQIFETYSPDTVRKVL